MSATETDLLYGVSAIADHLQLTDKQVYHLHYQGHIPTFRLGGKVCARRSSLESHLAAQEEAAANAEKKPRRDRSRAALAAACPMPEMGGRRSRLRRGSAEGGAR